jgi:hypothetical protein
MEQPGLSGVHRRAYVLEAGREAGRCALQLAVEIAAAGKRWSAGHAPERVALAGLGESGIGCRADGPAALGLPHRRDQGGNGHADAHALIASIGFELAKRD